MPHSAGDPATLASDGAAVLAGTDAPSESELADHADAARDPAHLQAMIDSHLVDVDEWKSNNGVSGAS